MAVSRANIGAGRGRAANPVRRQVLLAVYAGIVLLGVLLGVPPVVVDVLLICLACFTLGLGLIVLLARKMEEVLSFPMLVMGATCLHLTATVAAARRIILGDGQAGMIGGTIGGHITGLSSIISAGIFLVIAVVTVAVIVSAVRHIRTKVVLNIAVLAGHQSAQGAEAERRFSFNTAMGWAARYIVLDAVTSVLLLCVAVGGAGVIGTMEGVNYVATAVGVGLASLVPAIALGMAAAWLMSRDFVVCKSVPNETEKKQAAPRQAGGEQKATPAVPFREAVFDEPSSARAQREYQRIAELLLDGSAKDAKVVLLAAKSSAEMGVTIPVNVAAAIANRKKRCLVVDMDISRDAVAKAFDISKGEGPTKTCIRGLYVWAAKSFCDESAPVARKLEAAMKHFDKTIIYWPGAGQGYEEIVQNVGAAMLFGRKGVEMAVLEARLARRGCIMLL